MSRLHRYTSVPSSSPESFDAESKGQELDSSQSQRFWTREVITTTFITAATLSLILSAFSAFALWPRRLPSSKDVDPYSALRYSSDLASQSSYADQQSRWQTTDGVWTSCGHSPHQARERGCIFDIMSAVWLPTPCYNAEFSAEIVALHHSRDTTLSVSPKGNFGMTNFTWHSDSSLSPESFIPLHSLEEYFIAQWDAGEDMVAYSIENFHVAHCLYMMRAALRATERAAAGERHVYAHEEGMSRGHGEHCQNVLMNYEKWKEGVVALSFGMGWCKQLS